MKTSNAFATAQEEFYRRDPAHPQDDITWFLMEKASLQYGGSHDP
jgi:hypothetical protein